MAANLVLARPDVSDYVVHLTKGATDEAAFRNLTSIVGQRRILGNTRNMRGAYRCVCFTEAPLTTIADGLLNHRGFQTYSRFGVAFAKSWLFAQGGRPVIYQHDNEYSLLSEDFRWRHMRYEPGTYDFTWEREWRLATPELMLDPAHCGLVLPPNGWTNRLREAHNEQQDWDVHSYSELFDANLSELLRENFPWRIFELKSA